MITSGQLLGKVRECCIYVSWMLDTLRFVTYTWITKSVKTMSRWTRQWTLLPLLTRSAWPLLLEAPRLIPAGRVCSGCWTDQRRKGMHGVLREIHVTSYPQNVMSEKTDRCLIQPTWQSGVKEIESLLISFTPLCQVGWIRQPKTFFFLLKTIRGVTVCVCVVVVVVVCFVSQIFWIH